MWPFKSGNDKSQSHHTEESLLKELDRIQDPVTETGIVSCGRIKSCELTDDRAVVMLEIPPRGQVRYQVIQSEIEKTIQAHTGLNPTDIRVMMTAHKQKSAPTQQTLPHVKRIIAVASGKGGVGKSTIAYNLARQLQADGEHVGILDADIYGPSIPELTQTSGKLETEDNQFLPKISDGLVINSIGFMVEQDQSVVWRGAMVQKALLQMAFQTKWASEDRPLDTLVIDSPPGTGDIQLTLAQRLPITAALIVTTPHKLAQIDAIKAIDMFKKVNIPLLGVVENMSHFICDACDKQHTIFGESHTQEMCTQHNLPLLAQIPLKPNPSAIKIEI